MVKLKRFEFLALIFGLSAVDQAQTPPPKPVPGFVDQNSLIGVIDGTNATFTIPGVPPYPSPPVSLYVWNNGVLQDMNKNYNHAFGTIEFIPPFIPKPGDILRVSYRYVPTATSGMVTSSAPLPLGQLVFGLGGTAVVAGNLSGDASTSGDGVVTFASVNASPGTCGDATHVPQLTINAKGLTTACVPVPITGTGGASSLSQLTDFAPSLSSGTISVQPGTYRFGGGSYTFGTVSTANIPVTSGGPITATLYLSSTGALVLEYPSTLVISIPALSGITAQPVVTPAWGPNNDSFRIATLTMANGIGITAVTDVRSLGGRDALVGINGVLVAYPSGPGNGMVQPDPAIIPKLGSGNIWTNTNDFSNGAVVLNQTAPTSSTDACTPGSIWTGVMAGVNYIFVCLSSGNIQRAALLAF